MGDQGCRLSWSALTERNTKQAISNCGSKNALTKRSALVFVSIVLAAFLLFSIHSGEAIGADLTGPTGDERPPLPEQKPPDQLPSVTSPTQTPTEKKEIVELPLERVFVRKIIVTGSTVFSADELAEVTTPYVNRELTSEDLETLRRALTLYYVDKGYVNSGAIIPDQTVVDGAIRLHIVEGELSSIEVEGNKWFRDSFIQKRIALDAQAPVNINALQKRLLLLQQDQRILLLNAELSPGTKLGESVMKVRIEEKNPFGVSLAVDNYQSPSVGNPRGWMNLASQNLTGYGDTLSLTFGASEGLKPLVEARYTLPITPRDTSLALRYKLEKYEIVEKPFKSLDIKSETQYFTFTLRHPFYRSLNNEFSMALSGEHIRNETFLLGEKFSFSPGAQNGESIVTVLRFTQEWLSRAQTQAIAARSRFSFGIDALGATNNPGSTPDGQFFAWLGQFQWARVFGDIGIQMIFRTDIQLAAQSLLGVEQISIGGRYTVRGYRENTMARDNAVIASLESRIPLVRNRSWADYVQLVPFFDFGHGWNTDLPTPSLETISSAGLALRWAATFKDGSNEFKPQFELYWGYPFKDVDRPSDERDLQDDGIHFQFVFSAS